MNEEEFIIDFYSCDVRILTAKLQLIDDIIDILDCKDDIDKI